MPTDRSTGNGRTSKHRADSRNPIASSDTLDTDQLLAVLTAVRKGDFSVKMSMSQTGGAGKISDALNDIIELNRETSRELERVSQAVGKEGKITQRAHLNSAAGSWAASVNSVNTLIADLVQPTSEVARVIGAVAKGDLSQSMSLDIEGRPLMGEFLRIGKTVNSMVDQLSSFASEVTRVAREVGTEGKLGGQAQVKGGGGTWKDLTDKSELLRRQTQLLVESEQAARELAETRAELVRDLEQKNGELESFSYAVSHDLRAPLRRIDSFSRAVLQSQGERLDEQGRHYLERVQEASRHMSQLIDDVLYLSRVTRADLRDQDVDLSAVATLILSRLQESEPARKVEIKVRPGVVVAGDGQLLRIALENLLENAWKFTSQQPEARIEFGVTQASGEPTYFVRDNGAGFDMTYADRLFGPFQRLHPQGEFAGSGIGLATVQRIIHRHGGRVWAEGLVGQGATFQFTLGRVRP